ncbi:MAG: hypothetical protein COT73_08575 [Bdellovibrio sp. CG10_big_fil_rev_8_21_14_0_10_47_8]|nr:MAG: hypothetical protein COT73_08575 [Bdellovibrio sp. CG10_big_fil_rev_8_21_14_0_10_47_8]
MAFKAPFERIFSLIERKKILQRVAKEGAKVLLKSTKGEIQTFQTAYFDKSGDLFGFIKEPHRMRDFEKITALFYVDKDRYFITTRLKNKSPHWVLLNDAQFFKFNRRTAFRIHVPVGLEASFYVSTIRNIEINKKAPLIEFSSGGGRIYWPHGVKLAKGTILKGAIQWGKGKVLPVDATVVHSLGDGIWGLRFVNLTASSQNRLKMLSVEIQQTIHFGQRS